MRELPFQGFIIIEFTLCQRFNTELPIFIWLFIVFLKFGIVSCKIDF